MCGICGFLGAGAGEPRDTIRKMVASIEHRGPDAADAAMVTGSDHTTGWLGQSRLKVLDPSPAADQPMVSSDGRVTLVFNGEIYNFVDLRARLEAAGHHFRSHGDTEVALKAYLQWPRTFPEMLDGMFAIAVWDAGRDRLVLARDRAGKKPLYYAMTPDCAAFGSEIKALRAAPGFRAEVEPAAIAEYLAFGYVASPHTLYRGVSQVPPAGVVEWSGGEWSAPRAYWRLPEARSTGPQEREMLPVIRTRVEDAIRRRLVADVPVGAFLSGGIDSSVVVGLMSRLSAEPIRTFSVGLADEPSYDERRYARTVASRFGTEHTDFEVRADAAALLETLVWHHDQPFGDSSAVPTYLLCGLARRHVTVALTGDGGDEVFAGYDRFVAAKYAGRIPPVAGRLGHQLARVLPRTSGYGDARSRLERLFRGANEPVAQRYSAWLAIMPDEIVDDLIGEAVHPVAAAARRIDGRNRDSLDAIVRWNFESYLADDLAVKLDRMSMAHGLETRCPLLDTAVVEALFAIPAGRRVGGLRPKPLMRRAFGPLLPDEIWKRRKHGFGVPVATWLRGDLRPMFEDAVLPEQAQSRRFVRRDVVQRLWTEHQDGYADHGHGLWALLTLELWLRGLEHPVEVAPARDPAQSLLDAEAR